MAFVRLLDPQQSQVRVEWTTIGSKAEGFQMPVQFLVQAEYWSWRSEPNPQDPGTFQVRKDPQTLSLDPKCLVPACGLLQGRSDIGRLLGLDFPQKPERQVDSVRLNRTASDSAAFGFHRQLSEPGSDMGANLDGDERSHWTI